MIINKNYKLLINCIIMFTIGFAGYKGLFKYIHYSKFEEIKNLLIEQVKQDNPNWCQQVDHFTIHVAGDNYSTNVYTKNLPECKGKIIENPLPFSYKDKNSPSI